MIGRWSLSLLSAILACGFVFPTSTGNAAEFPALSSSYCIKLNSKLLDPNEKTFETDKCLAEDQLAKSQLEKHWDIVTDSSLKKCMSYSNDSYVLLQFCLAGDVGWQCFKGDLTCK